VNKRQFDSLCESGCINFGRKWACPPFSPSFSDFVIGWERIIVIYMRVATVQLSYIKNDYLKIKAANSIMKSRADRFLREMAHQYGSYISMGSCRLCNPCKRTVDKQCAKPDKMTFSFEALGVDVDQMVNSCFSTPLQWYKSGCLPEYTAVVCGLLTNETISANDLCKKYYIYSNMT